MKKLLALLCSVMLLSFAGCSGQAGKVREIDRSLEGSVQIDEVNWSGGATAGESYLVIETSANGGFSAVGDKEPASAIMIKETRYSYNTDYTVIWLSEDSFVAQWANRQRDSFNVAHVDLTDDGYEISCGTVSLDRDDSFLSGFEIVDDQVYITCSLQITNDSTEDVRFTIDAKADSDDVGHLLEGVDLISVDDEGHPMIYEIAAGSTETYTVVFMGSKGPDDTKADRNLPPTIYLFYYYE